MAFVLWFPALALAASQPQGRVDVVDADTWDVGGTRIRLHGIDSPELDQNCVDAQGRDWACGTWATQEARKRYQGKTARCSPMDRDRYGRIVARCQVDGADVAQAMVVDGLALAYRKYSDDYVAAETTAATTRAGLHAGYVLPPWVHRASGKGACQIKGNISSSGEKIYRVPGQRYYTKTKITLSNGERWFCSEAEARAAGWRASKR